MSSLPAPRGWPLVPGRSQGVAPVSSEPELVSMTGGGEAAAARPASSDDRHARSCPRRKQSSAPRADPRLADRSPSLGGCFRLVVPESGHVAGRLLERQSRCPPPPIETPASERLRQRARFAGRPIPSKHNHVLHGHGPYRGALRPRSRGCRLATRSGHLVPAATRAAPYRPDQERGGRRRGWLLGRASDSQVRLRSSRIRQAASTSATPATGAMVCYERCASVEGAGARRWWEFWRGCRLGVGGASVVRLAPLWSWSVIARGWVGE